MGDIRLTTMARITGPVTMLVLVAAAGCTSTARHPDETDNPVPAAERGAAGVGDRLFPTLGNGGYDVTHYDLKLEYAPSTNHLKGTAVITARATSNLRSFNLDFAGMKVRNTKVDNSGAAFSRAKNELTVTPAKTLRKGDSFRAEVAYDGTPRTIDGDEAGSRPTTARPPWASPWAPWSGSRATTTLRQGVLRHHGQRSEGRVR